MTLDQCLQLPAVIRAFADHPEWGDVYVFDDGTVENGEDYRRLCDRRAALRQNPATEGYGFFALLVEINTRGLPMNVDRRALARAGA